MEAVAYALRSGALLREKVIVLRLSGDTMNGPALIALAADMAVLRAIDVRLVVVSAPPDAGASVRLCARLGAQGVRAIAVQSSGLVTVTPLPHATADGSAGPLVPTVTSVDAVALLQLCTLQHVPIVLLPLLDVDGSVVPVPVDEVAQALARGMGAIATVHVGDPPAVLTSPIAIASPAQRALHVATPAHRAVLSALLGAFEPTTSP